MIVTHVTNERTIAFEFVHIQSTPNASWVIVHNMDCHPGVTVIDSASSQVEGDVVYDSFNQLTINFTGAFSGKAVLR
jgi:hypothetical protein